MTLQLKLSSDLEERLLEEAQKAGMLAEQYTLHLLETHLLARNRRQHAVDLLQSWIDSDDADEQNDTGDYLIRSLDEDRLSDRKLFPRELQGVTW
ncbi:MAG: hypothetical protein AAF657_10680 [Acidobacteriota bacterium]